MRNKRLYSLQAILLIIGGALLAGCILSLGYFLYDSFSAKSFYQKGSGWDYLRFPLLEPYYAIYVIGPEDENEQYGWQIPVQEVPLSKRNFRSLVNILDVKKIAVEDGVIMVYSSYSKPILLTGEALEKKELHWFILIPGQAEIGFETEEEFLLRLQQQGIDRIRWHEPDALLQQFDRTRCLKWIPGCK